jgi:HAD superfamily hydrolase (TIGR01549 family)
MDTSVLSPNTRLVIFDLDGTLYDKRGIIGKMMMLGIGHWSLLLAERRTRKAFRGLYMGSEELFYRAYFHKMAKRTLLSEKQVSKWYHKVYMPMMVRVLQRWHHAMPWVEPFVKECRERGIKMVVLSDYGHTHEKLAALGLDISLFDWIVSAPELGGLKPAPQLIYHVIEKMGVSSNECLVIGDREDTDGELAHVVNAGFYQVKY